MQTCFVLAISHVTSNKEKVILQTCNIDTDDFVGTVFYKCDGAFTFIPVNESDGVHVQAMLCEGAMFQMSEVERTEAAAPSLLQADPPSWCPPGVKCANAMFCLANSQIITSRALPNNIAVASEESCT